MKILLETRIARCLWIVLLLVFLASAFFTSFDAYSGSENDSVTPLWYQQEGGDDRFREIHKANKKWVAGYVSRFIYNSHDQDDVNQAVWEAFLKGYKPEKPPKPYLRKIADSKISDFYEKWTAKNTVQLDSINEVDDISETYAQPSKFPEQLEEYQWSRIRKYVREHMIPNLLGSDQRTVAMSHYIIGLNPSEISIITDIPRTTVNRYLSRINDTAIRHLKKQTQLEQLKARHSKSFRFKKGYAPPGKTARPSRSVGVTCEIAPRACAELVRRARNRNKR